MSDYPKPPRSAHRCIPEQIPFPGDLRNLKGMSPLIVRQEFNQVYLHSYGQDSPFFAGLANGVLLGTRCPRCPAAYATPRLACSECGGPTEWFELPPQGRIHTYTVCHFAGESFLDETPFALILVEFDGVDTLFLSRLYHCPFDEVRIGMEVRPRFARPPGFNVSDVYFTPA